MDLFVAGVVIILGAYLILAGVDGTGLAAFQGVTGRVAGTGVAGTQGSVSTGTAGTSTSLAAPSTVASTGSLSA